MNLLEKIKSGVYVIAEMSANHNGDFNKAVELIHAAKNSGADCLKIQTYTADSMTIDCDNEYFRIKGGLWDGYNLYNLYKEAATPYEWQGKIKEECEKIGLDFLSTPFDKEGVDFLESLGAGAYKVASFELVDIPLIKYIALKGKPMILSCGMGTTEDIDDAVEAILGEGLSGDKIVLLKCTSAYPALASEMNLQTITDMASRYGVTVGLSDHSMSNIAPITAVALGAKVIEKHICLSRALGGVDSGFSLEPKEFLAMSEAVREAFLAKGCVQYGASGKEKDSVIFRRSIFAVKDIKKGEAFTSENIRVIRPGHGEKPKKYEELLETSSTSEYKRGEPVKIGNSLKFNKSDEFESERLTLRGISERDADNLIKWRSRYDVYKYALNPKPITKDEHTAWYTRYATNDYGFRAIITEKISGADIGMVGGEYENNAFVISYHIGEPEYRRRGFAREAICALTGFINAAYGITTFHAYVQEENTPSVTCLEKAEFCLKSRNNGVILYEYIKTIGDKFNV